MKIKNKVNPVLFAIFAAVLFAAGAGFFAAERAEARGLGKLILSPVVKAIGGKAIGKAHKGKQINAPYNGPIMSKAELRQCLQSQSDIEDSDRRVEIIKSAIDSYDTDIEKAERKLRPIKSEVDSLSSRIDATEPFVNQYSQQSVDNYNALIDKYKSAERKYNAAADDINAAIRRRNEKFAQYEKSLNAHNLSIETFNQKCANPYHESDMQEILAEKAANN